MRALVGMRVGAHKMFLLSGSCPRNAGVRVHVVLDDAEDSAWACIEFRVS